MIGLVGVLPPPGDSAGTVCLGALPEAPASQFSGFAVLCVHRAQVCATLNWFREVRELRPTIPLGMVADPDQCADALAELPFALTFRLSTGDLIAGGLPTFTLNQLREASLEGSLIAEVLHTYGGLVSPEIQTIRAVVARAVHGGTLSSAARDLDVSPETLRLRLGQVGIRAVDLRRWVRVRAYELRIGLGVDAGTAAAACGWTSQDQRRKAFHRFREMR